ncbi:MAG: heme-binding protein [Erythrobacter sp.]
MKKLTKIAIGIGATLSVAALGGVVAAAQYRENIEEPAHEVIATGEGFELRQYAPMITAEVTIEGDRRRATRAGFQRLAAYIFAQDRPGAAKDADQKEKIAMTSPVMQDQTQKIAMTSPVMQDNQDTEDANGPWRTRFVMPSKYTMETLPETPSDITLNTVPARRMAAVMFNGFGSADDLAVMETKLRTWIAEKGYETDGKVEYAFYDGPWVPGQYRRNEVLIPVAMPDTND